MGVDAPSPDDAPAAGDPVLRRTRARIEALAVDDGAFVVACRDAGVRPAPVTGHSFESYEAAEAAGVAARRYRAALRRLDPTLPTYDLAVSEATPDGLSVTTIRESTGERRANGLPRARRTVTLTGRRNDEWLRVEDGPVVHLAGRDARLDDEVVARQLAAKLDP